MRLSSLARCFRREAEKTVLLVLGCQRSGTTMLIDVLARSPDFSVYGEDHPAAMQRMRLRDERTIHRVIRRDPARVLVFKPLNDAQDVDRLLGIHPDTRAIWIYRGYRDTAGSAVTKWSDTQKRIMAWIARHERDAAVQPGHGNEHYRVYLERMHPDTRALVARLAADAISAHDGAALLWYARNRIFFDQGLEKNPRVRLVCYEDVVRAPETELARIFTFAGRPFSRAYAADVSRQSRARPSTVALTPGIEAGCEELTRALDAECARQAAPRSASSAS